MNSKIVEVDGQLVCQKYDHNEPVIMIAMEEAISTQERFLCVKCLQQNRQIVRLLAIDSVKEMIKEKQIQLEQPNEVQRQKDLRNIKVFQEKIKNISNELIMGFEQINNLAQQWIKEYDKKEDEGQLINLIRGLELLKQTNKQKEIEQMCEMNQSYFLKISKSFKKIISIFDLKSPYEQLKSLNLKKDSSKELKQSKQNQKDQQIYQDQQNTNQSICKVKLINSVSQNEMCYAIAFNNNGQIMIAGCDKYIKVWKFEKTYMTCLDKLYGHSKNITCLIFSKKFSWFASGSGDNTVRCWKEQIPGQWESTQPGEKHTDLIRCILLNSNEGELISCSDDQKIVVWNVNCQINQLNYYYTIDKKHSDSILCINMNDNETKLISCSLDKKIILWNKDKYSKWQYENEILNVDYGFRLCFISDNQIVWQQYLYGITHFFEIKNGTLIQRPELSILLNQESDDYAFFPTIFNKKRQIIVQSHDRYVYLLKKKENDKLYTITYPIDCRNWINFGSLTDDGEYLVVWNKGTSEFRVHEIQYK